MWCKPVVNLVYFSRFMARQAGVAKDQMVGPFARSTSSDGASSRFVPEMTQRILPPAKASLDLPQCLVSNSTRHIVQRCLQHDTNGLKDTTVVPVIRAYTLPKRAFSTLGFRDFFSQRNARNISPLLF